MSVYDRAHELARALVQSREYLEWIEAKELLEQDQANYSLVEDWRQKQLELQMATLAGREIGEDQREQIEKLWGIVQLNPAVREYLDREFGFARLMTDIQKIISQAIGPWSDQEE
jgi:cell fate (sporulation/competence/biofilm development) regulator YlbF (YheA/YmcA/DUF963 family)